jgi:hypothetical protein
MVNDTLNHDIKQQLHLLISVFITTAIECAESMFQKECRILGKWEVIDRLEGKFDHISSIGCASNEFQAIMTANIDNPSLPAFFGNDFSENNVYDVLGEFCNNFCGLIMDKEPVRTVFGLLRQALPLYAAHCSFFPRVPGIHGRLYIGDQWIYIGYAIRKTKIFTIDCPV